MTHLTGDWIGVLHLASSILSMIFGAAVLLSGKGTPLHKKMGYAYTVNMLIILITALFIYRLFGSFGPFHYLAIIGFFYLAGGIIPVLFRLKNWIKIHVYFMYWSVVGLYAAFMAEVAVRIPNVSFWWMVGIGTGTVTLLGGIFYSKKKSVWFNIRNRKTG